MIKRILLALVFILSLSLAACAPTPVTISQLPIFTGATESTNADFQTAMGPAIDTLKTSGTVDFKIYDLPAGTKFDAVKSFFTTSLKTDGWTDSKNDDKSLSLTRGSQGVVIFDLNGTGYSIALVTGK